MAVPPLSPENLSAYQKENSAAGRLQVLRRDFCSTKAYSDYADFTKKAPKQRARINLWIPELEHHTRFIQFTNGQSATSSIDFLFKSYPRRFAYVFAGAFLWASLFDLLLRGIRWTALENTSPEDPNKYAKYLWIFDQGRLDSIQWAVPSSIFSNSPLPILSFLTFSPVVLIAAILVSVTYPRKILVRICLLWALALIPYAWLTGLGAIPVFRLWALTVGLTCVIGPMVAVIKSRNYLVHFEVARQEYAANYQSFVEDSAHGVRREDQARQFVGDLNRVDAANKLYGSRGQSLDNFRQFVDAEQQLNKDGLSGIPGLRSVGTPGIDNPTLAELVDKGRIYTTPAELSIATGISIQDATEVLSAPNTRTLRSDLHPLYYAFR